MGQRSKLTESQWLEIERRLLVGEARRALAREFKITEGAIRQRLSTRVSEAKAIASQIVDSERRLSALPIATQIATRTLADRLRSISNNLSAAADYGSMTAHRLQAIANAQAEKVDDADPGASMDALRNIKMLAELANDSAKTGLSLLAANKGSDPPEPPTPPPDRSPVIRKRLLDEI